MQLECEIRHVSENLHERPSTEMLPPKFSLLASKNKMKKTENELAIIFSDRKLYQPQEIKIPTVVLVVIQIL